MNLYSEKESKKNWKSIGPVMSEFDQSLKGYVLSLINGGVSKIQIPKSEKNLLGIVQPYVALQIYLHSSKSFSMEISISDITKVFYFWK